MAVVAIIILVIPALNDDGSMREMWPKEFDTEKNRKTAICLIVICTILIFFAAAFDLMFEALEHMFTSVFRPILDALYKELMSLGLMGLMEFVIIKFEMLTALSEYLFCQKRYVYENPCTSDGTPVR